MILGVIQLIFALLAGAVLGAFYFAGLWYTVRRLPSAKNPALLSLGSFLLRASVALSGFYFVMGEQWPRLAVCMIGFMGARVVLIRRLKVSTSPMH